MINQEAIHEETTWGVRINTARYSNRRGRHMPNDSPPWMNLADADTWERRGVVIWNNATEQLHHWAAEDAAKVLDQLRAKSSWKVDGLPISQTITTVRFPDQRVVKRSYKKNSEQPVIQPSEPVREMVVQELFRLSGDAATSLYAFLEAHAELLYRLSDEDKKEQGEVLGHVYSIIFGAVREKDVQSFDSATRDVAWRRGDRELSLICDQPPNRATVQPSNGNWFWQRVIEQPDRFKHESPRFAELEQAVEWCETELSKITDEANARAEQATGVEIEPPFVPGPHLDPYRIAPAVLEPKRSTYRVIVDLEYEPFDYKTQEISFGNLRRYDKRYHTPTALAHELRLDLDKVQIEQVLGSTSGWYQVHSLATYYYSDVATSQAQKLWDASALTQRYKEHKLKRARYGIEEVETGYCTWLGGLEIPEQPMPREHSRDEYLADSAIRLTLIHALDVDGFRSYLKLNPKYISDDALLHSMHQQRAASQHLPAIARAESVAWLQTHPEPTRSKHGEAG